MTNNNYIVDNSCCCFLCLLCLRDTETDNDNDTAINVSQRLYLDMSECSHGKFIGVRKWVLAFSVIIIVISDGQSSTQP